MTVSNLGQAPDSGPFKRKLTRMLLNFMLLSLDVSVSVNSSFRRRGGEKVLNLVPGSVIRTSDFV